MPQEKQLLPKFNYKAVFNPDDYLYFYGESLTEERTEKEVEGLVSLLRLDKPLKILDLACGHGRHANRLAKRGHNVTGIDIMSGFLEIAREDAKKLKVSAKYIRKDMRDINYTNEFDIILLLFTSFGYFNDEDNKLVLMNIFKALKRGGCLCFDIHNRDVTAKNMRPYNVIEKEGNFQIDRNTIDSERGLWINRRVIIRNGVRKDSPFFIRLYNPNEIRYLLSDTGFADISFYCDWEGNPVSINSGKMITVARK